MLLMLVLATTTIPRQWDRLTLKLVLDFVLIIRTTVVYLPPPSTRSNDVPRMPSTPFWTGSSVRNLEPCVVPVALSVELFLMTNSLVILLPFGR